MKKKCQNCKSDSFKFVCRECGSDRYEITDWKIVPSILFTVLFLGLSVGLASIGMSIFSSFITYYGLEKLDFSIEVMISISLIATFFCGLFIGKKEEIFSRFL